MESNKQPEDYVRTTRLFFLKGDSSSMSDTACRHFPHFASMPACLVVRCFTFLPFSQTWHTSTGTPDLRSTLIQTFVALS